MNYNSNIKYNNPITKKAYKPAQCPKGNVIYRLTFKYKTNFSGKKLFNLTSKNFPDFEMDIPNRPLKPGDYVKYTPKNRNDPNWGKLAMITIETNKRFYGKIVKKYDLTFLAPKNVNNKVISSIKDIPEKDKETKVLTIIPQLRMYHCSSPFVPINRINEFQTAYKLYNQNKGNKRLRVLEEAGEELFDTYFVLGKNNEPLYPEFVKRGQPNYEIQTRMKNKLNKEIDRIVKSSFLSGTSSQKPKVKMTKNGKTLQYVVPKGAERGSKITVHVDGYDVKVAVPMTATPLSKVTVPISQSDNDTVYNSLKVSKKSIKNEHLTFLPHFITAKYSNSKHLDIHKLVKPSSNQLFKIKSADIIKQNGNNFKFKELPRFNKAMNPLIFDIEIHVDLGIEVSKKFKDGDGNRKKIFGKIGDMILNSGTGCPSKMRKLKESLRDMNETFKKKLTRGEKISRTKRTRKKERKKGREKFNKKYRKIIKNRTRGKKRQYGGKKRKTRKIRRRRR